MIQIEKGIVKTEKIDTMNKLEHVRRGLNETAKKMRLDFTELDSKTQNMF